MLCVQEPWYDPPLSSGGGIRGMLGLNDRLFLQPPQFLGVGAAPAPV
jgi:hypothetical protein